MKAEIIYRVEGEEDDEISIWELKTPKGKVLNIADILDHSVSDCNWVDEDHEFLDVFYSDWDSSEFSAILNKNGDVLRKGILEIAEYVKEHALFVVRMSGFGMHDEARDYDMESDDEKMAVINRFGGFVVPPEYDRLGFEPDDNLFYADNYRDDREFYFTLEGNPVSPPDNDGLEA